MTASSRHAEAQKPFSREFVCTPVKPGSFEARIFSSSAGDRF
jgi:hypothetical protein